MRKTSVRTLLISNVSEWWRYASAPYRLTNGTEGWALALQGDFYGMKPPPRDVLAQYDLVIANLDRALIPRFAAMIEQRPSHVKWVSLTEGCATDYLAPSPELIRVLNASDLVATINARATGYLRSLSQTRTEWIGVPYPAEAIGAFATPPERRRDEVLICPRLTLSRPSVVVANALCLPLTAYLPKVSRKPRNLPLFWRHRCFQSDLRLRLWGREPSPVPRIPRPERVLCDFWKEAGGCRLWIDLDPRYTWARYVLDAAALGVPIIATENTVHAPALFPETTVKDVFCVEAAISIGKRLLAEPDWAWQVVQAAREKLKTFSPEACVRRLSAALQMPLPLPPCTEGPITKT